MKKTSKLVFSAVAFLTTMGFSVVCYAEVELVDMACCIGGINCPTRHISEGIPGVQQSARVSDIIKICGTTVPHAGAPGYDEWRDNIASSVNANIMPKEQGLKLLKASRPTISASCVGSPNSSVDISKFGSSITCLVSVGIELKQDYPTCLDPQTGPHSVIEITKVSPEATETIAIHDEDVPQSGLVGSVLPLAAPMAVDDHRNVTDELSPTQKLEKLQRDLQEVESKMLKNQDEVKQKRDKIAENEARMQAIEAQVQANIRAYNAQVAAIDQQDTEATHDEDVPQPGLVGSVLPLATPMVVGDQRNVTEASLMEKLRKLNTLPPPPMSAQDTQRIKALIDQRNKLKQKKELLEEANERLNKDNQHLGGSGAGGSSTSCTAQ